MTNRGLPSSSILGSCGMRRCCCICRSDQLLPRASTTSARLAGSWPSGAPAGLRTRRRPTSTHDRVVRRIRAGAGDGLSETPPTTSMDAGSPLCLAGADVFLPSSCRGREKISSLQLIWWSGREPAELVTDVWVHGTEVGPKCQCKFLCLCASLFFGLGRFSLLAYVDRF